MKDEALRKLAVTLCGRRAWTQEEARQVLQLQEASGQSMTVFARRLGVRRQRLSWWRARLAGVASNQQEPAGCEQALRLVPVVVRQTPAAPAQQAPLSVCIGDLVRVEIRQADPATAGWVAQLAVQWANGGAW